MLDFFAAFFGGALFGWWWDRPALVRDKAIESPLEKHAQISSAVFWPTLALWLAAGTPHSPAWLDWLARTLGAGVLSPLMWTILVTLFATVVLMRRAMASTGRGWPLGYLVRDYKTWVLFHRKTLLVPFVFFVAVLPLYWLTGDRDEYMSMHTAPVLTLFTVGLIVTMREHAWGKKIARLRPSLAQAHGVSEPVMEGAYFKPTKAKGFLMVKVPAQVVSHEGAIVEGIALHLPEYEAKVNRNAAGKMTSIAYVRVGAEASEQREIRRATGGLVVSLTPAANPHPARPAEHVAALSSKISKTMAADVDARLEDLGYTVVEWLPSKGVAHVARLDEDTYAARKRLSEVLGCEPHMIEIQTEWIHDEKLERERIEKVTVLRSPSKGTNAERRTETWRDLVLTLPDGSSGWKIEEDLVTGVVVLTYGQPRVLPSSVTYSDIGLEPVVRRDLWHELPIGLNPEGQIQKVSLRSGPHIGLGGATGAGKSVTIRALLTGALLHGMQIVVIDPKKSAGDFRAFEPYALAWGDDTLEQAADILETVYAEGARRKAILKSMRLPDIWELSQAERDKHGIKPILCVFDEYQSAMIAKSVPKGVDRDDPLMQRAQAHNYAVARIQDTAQSGVLELRYVGIHFAFAGQVVSVEAFGSALRANLSSVIYGVPPTGGITPKREILGMQFGDSAHDALDLIAALRTRDPGLGLSAGEDGAVDACRVAFGKPEEIAALLEAAGVEKPTKWDLVERAAPEVEGEIIGGKKPIPKNLWGPKPPATPTAVAAAPALVEVKDLDEMEVSMDDLAGDTDNEDPFAGFTVEEVAPVAARALAPVAPDGLEDFDFESAPVAPRVVSTTTDDGWDDEPATKAVVKRRATPVVTDDLWD